MHIACNQRGGDLGRGEKHHLDIGEPGQRGAVTPVTGGLFQRRAGVAEILLDAFLETALGRDRERERGHTTTPCARRAARIVSVRSAQPTAGTARPAPMASSSVSYRPPPAISTAPEASRDQSSKTKPV